MNKKYIVRLSDEERDTCQQVIKQLKGSSQKVRRAHLLLKADADVRKALSDKELEENFDLDHHLKHVDTIFNRVFGAN